VRTGTATEVRVAVPAHGFAVPGFGVVDTAASRLGGELGVSVVLALRVGVIIALVLGASVAIRLWIVPMVRVVDSQVRLVLVTELF
jgi:hypothetical protein